MSAIAQETGWFFQAGLGDHTLHIWVDMTLKALPPDVAEVARICALPAQLDARLLMLLTGKSSNEAGAYLAALVAADMVTPQGHNSYVYHKAVRDDLLTTWEAPEHRAQFAALAKRLGGYYLMLIYEQVLRLGSADRQGALEALDRYYPNIQAAWEAIVTTQNWSLIGDFASLMDIYHGQRGRWERNVAWLKHGIAACDHRRDHEGKAALQNSLGVSYMQLTTGDDIDNTRRAIACYREALNVYTPEAVPMDYAMVQNNLGNAYARLAGTDETQSLHQAIACYTEAARYWTLERAPLSCAMVYNNLGNAYTALTTGDREVQLQKAIDCYQHALKVYGEMAMSPGYAELQFKLGKTYAALPGGRQTEKRSANLHRAITCYKTALTVYTRDNAPRSYAETQMELGNIYMQLSAEDPENNMHSAIACYREALHVWTTDITALGSPEPVIAQEKLRATYLDLARLYLKEGKVDRIHALYHEIKEINGYDTL